MTGGATGGPEHVTQGHRRPAAAAGVSPPETPVEVSRAMNRSDPTGEEEEMPVVFDPGVLVIRGRARLMPELLLGIPISAPDRVVRRARMQLNRRFHPDKAPGCVDLCQQVNSVADILLERRAAYETWVRSGLIPLQLAHSTIVHESPIVHLQDNQTKTTLAALLLQGEQNMTTALNQQRHLSRTVEQLEKDAAQSRKMTKWMEEEIQTLHTQLEEVDHQLLREQRRSTDLQAQLDDIQQQLKDQIAVAEASQRSELRAVNRAQKAQAAAFYAARAEAAAETEAAVLAARAEAAAEKEAAVLAVRAEVAAEKEAAVLAARAEAAAEREAAVLAVRAEVAAEKEAAVLAARAEAAAEREAAVLAARVEAAAETAASIPSWTAAAVSAVRAEMAAAVQEACAKAVAAARCEAAEERVASPDTPYAEAVIAANGRPSAGVASAAIGRAATATLLDQAGAVTAATGSATAAAPADRAGAATGGATAGEQRTVNHPAVREMVRVCLRGIVDRQNNSPLRRKA